MDWMPRIESSCGVLDVDNQLNQVAMVLIDPVVELSILEQRLKPSVQNLIVRTERERRWLGRSDSRVAWEVVLFSIKESVFKAWSPLDGRRLGFQDVQVTLDPEAAALQADVLAPPPGPTRSLSGHFAVTADLVFSAVALPRPQS